MKQFLSLVAVCIFLLSAWAQETVAVNTGDSSPEVKNQTVTFRLLAPEARGSMGRNRLLWKVPAADSIGRGRNGRTSTDGNREGVCGAIRLLSGLRPNCILIAFMWMACVCLILQCIYASWYSYFTWTIFLWMELCLRIILFWEAPHGTVAKVWYPSPFFGGWNVVGWRYIPSWLWGRDKTLPGSLFVARGRRRWGMPEWTGVLCTDFR